MGKPENPIYINLYFRVKTKYPVDIPLNQSIDDCLQLERLAEMDKQIGDGSFNGGFEARSQALAMVWLD